MKPIKMCLTNHLLHVLIQGRTYKYDRSLFARLEEAGHAVHMLDTQFRMVRVPVLFLFFSSVHILLDLAKLI